MIEITLFTRITGDADIHEIARRHRLPSAVLEPTFAELADQGMIVRDDGAMALTAAGQTEVDRVTMAFRTWLAEQLADWEQGPGIEDIGNAIDRIARRMLDHDEPGAPRSSPRGETSGRRDGLDYGG